MWKKNVWDNEKVDYYRDVLSAELSNINDIVSCIVSKETNVSAGISEISNIL
jgi:hypothetical protein